MIALILPCEAGAGDGAGWPEGGEGGTKRSGAAGGDCGSTSGDAAAGSAAAGESLAAGENNDPGCTGGAASSAGTG